MELIKKSLLIKFLGENLVFKIVDFMIENKGLDMSKKNIIECAGISKATLFNAVAENDHYTNL